MNRTLVSCIAAVAAGVLGCQAPTISIASISLPAIEAEGDWLDKRARLVELATSRAPDVIALQGATAVQVLQLRDALHGYTCVATGAQDGIAAGDMNPLFVRSGRLDVADQGHFWLSSTPREVGSRDWGASEPRVATWVHATYGGPAGGSIRVLNTRFDPQSIEARQRGAEVVRRFAEAFGTQSVVIAGDFSAPPGSRAYGILTEDYRFANKMKDVLVEQTRRGLPSDAARAAAADATRKRHVFVSQGVEVVSAEPGWFGADNGAELISDAPRAAAPPAGADGVLFATVRGSRSFYVLAP
jgi:endonuclease/exonuclease/phosphatase family metal-dependent hydrolase